MRERVRGAYEQRRANYPHFLRPVGRQQTIAEEVGLARIDRQQGQGDMQTLAIVEIGPYLLAQQRIGPAAVESQVVEDLRYVGRLRDQQRVHQRPRSQYSMNPPAAE